MIDSHCHLNFKHYNGRRDEVVTEAADAGVHTIINIGIDLDTSQQSIDLAERFDSIWATVGVHPHESDSLTDEVLDSLRRMAGHSRVKAIGEIGLDYYRDLSPRKTQQSAFRRQLELAAELSMPIVIHTREAMADTLDMVRDFVPDLPGGVFHCFPGDESDARKVIDMGFVMGMGGSMTFKKSRMGRVAAAVPLETILLETDAPFLAPVPHRGKTNYPSYIALICRHLADLRGLDSGEVETVTDRTCRKLFRLVDVFGE